MPTRTPGLTLGLARGLISAASPRPKRTVAKRLQRLREQAKRLQLAWIDVHRPQETAQVKPFDVVLDRRWGALRSRLEGCVQLEDEDESPRAETLVRVLFPTGLDFLTLPYAEEWAQSERRLVQIDTDGLADEIDALAGAKYLAALREAHDAYGKALGITKVKEDEPEAALVIGPLRDLQAAIVSYARGVVGTVDEDDPAAVKAAEKQLEPILRARKARPSGSSGAAEVEEPIEAPVPELPEATAEEEAVAE